MINLAIVGSKVCISKLTGNQFFAIFIVIKSRGNI
jgi:hypothetical protein